MTDPRACDRCGQLAVTTPFHNLNLCQPCELALVPAPTVEPVQPWELPRCRACAAHPGWSHGDESRRREPRDVCRVCYGSGVDQNPPNPPTCWCGEYADVALTVDPVVTTATLTVIADGQPAAPRCDEHAVGTLGVVHELDETRPAADPEWWARP